jgi:hypothetical protein
MVQPSATHLSTGKLREFKQLGCATPPHCSGAAHSGLTPPVRITIKARAKKKANLLVQMWLTSPFANNIATSSLSLSRIKGLSEWICFESVFY